MFDMLQFSQSPQQGWNPIEADGYRLIDCLWVSGSFKGHGYSNDQLGICVADSREKGTIYSVHRKRGGDGRGNKWWNSENMVPRKGYEYRWIHHCDMMNRILWKRDQQNWLLIPATRTRQKPCWKTQRQYMRQESLSARFWCSYLMAGRYHPGGLSMKKPLPNRRMQRQFSWTADITFIIMKVNESAGKFELL